MAESDKRERSDRERDRDREKDSLRESNGAKKEGSLAGIAISELKGALDELRHKKKEDWRNYGARDFRHYLEKKFDLEQGALKKHEDTLGKLVDQVEEDYTEEKKRKKREAEKKKREAEKAAEKAAEKDEDKSDKSSKSSKRSEKSKRRRSSSSEERPAKKSKRYGSSSGSSESSRKKKSRKPKKDPDNPDVQRIERLKKVIRGCGVPLTGFHNDMSNDSTIRKLKKIIADHEKDGMKEKMSRKEMTKVRAAIEANREVEELKRIPKKLQISGKHPRKVHRKRPSYDTDLPKTGLYFLDRESSSRSSSSSKDSTYSN